MQALHQGGCCHDHEKIINQSINFTVPALCWVCKGDFGFCLSMNPYPELPITSCVAASEHPGVSSHNPSSILAA